ncbi:MAG: NusG domain II-containing protein [Synergistaceae bacterium]|nr:NusG domain II-containing protein [Synergistaceae bacterium]
MIRRSFFSRRDIFFLSCILLALSAFYRFEASGASGGGKNFAEISVNGSISEMLPLELDREYIPPGLPAVRIVTRGGAAGFVASDCPDKVCIHTGFLTKPGQAAACLPNRVVIRVSPGGADTLDSVVY